VVPGKVMIVLDPDFDRNAVPCKLTNQINEIIRCPFEVGLYLAAVLRISG
jgi:hypothetical protein